MFFLRLPLLFCGVNWISEGAFIFSQQPNLLVYFMGGSDAVLEWKYLVDNRTAEFQYISWDVEKGGHSTPMVIENATGYLTYTAAYAGRVQKRSQATLVLRNVDIKNSSIMLKCFLIHTSGRQNVSTVKLIVTGQASMLAPVLIAAVGNSVVFICNATHVPKQSFSWLKLHGQIQKVLADNGQDISIASKTGSSVLTMKNIAEDNKGYYTCDATANVNQPNFVTGYLQLLEPLRLDNTFCRGRPIFTAVNECRTLCCPVNGYPPPIVTWEKNGTRLETGENKCFTIASVQSGHFGDYTCVGTDGKTSIGPFVLSLVEKEEPAGTLGQL
ncbi:opioid-binding protein/cell adhesion molecule-like isoform X1 [Montipora foliosa]|uniref:opioid-binding protein/cell adhesion molecule-like isoform X1 n=1 Tax=Montipora foliosa TaxID=591990 RepID=UPI0035F14C9A